MKTPKKKWFWTDEKVMIFTQIYSLNLCSRLVDEDVYFYSNYKGKNVEEKIKQFKIDYK